MQQTNCKTHISQRKIQASRQSTANHESKDEEQEVGSVTSQSLFVRIACRPRYLKWRLSFVEVSEWIRRLRPQSFIQSQNYETAHQADAAEESVAENWIHFDLESGDKWYVARKRH